MTAAAPTTTAEDPAKRLADYERLAISTGEFAGADAPLFSANGHDWAAAWADRENHPLFASATVYRSTGARGVTVVLAWDEVAPTEEEALTAWKANPMTRFGAAPLRRAYQRAFADVIQPETIVDTPPAKVLARDFDAEIEAATTAEAVRAIHSDAKDAREVTPALEQKLRAKLATLAPKAQPSRPTRADATPRAGAVPKPPAAGVHRLDEIAPKPSTRKSKSRASRDSGRRGGGRPSSAA